MPNFTGYQDFFGSYSGHCDGRKANLKIGDAKGDSVLPMFHLEFTDLDRGLLYHGTHTEKGPDGHIMHDITLNQKGGSDTVTWSRLHLHTWDTDYLSGISIWNHKEFGLNFSRVR